MLASPLCTSYQPTFVVAVKASTPKQQSDNKVTTEEKV
jgi:hypothetical protein